jgi:hypothetical protein
MSMQQTASPVRHHLLPLSASPHLLVSMAARRGPPGAVAAAGVVRDSAACRLSSWRATSTSSSPSSDHQRSWGEKSMQGGEGV